MSLEITRGKSLYQYRISPDNACEVQHRPNRHGARWTLYLAFGSAKEAKAALFALRQDTIAKEDKNP